MKKGKTVEELTEVIESYLPSALQSQKMINDMSTHLSVVHNISKGKFMYYIGSSKRLSEAEWEVLGLLAEQFHFNLKIEELTLENWFTSVEIKKLKSFKLTNEHKDNVEEELVFENVVYLGDGVYQAAAPYSLVARLYKHKRLHYNFAFQREAVKVVVGDKVVPEMRIYKKNVREIKQRVLEGKLKKTALAYNCRVGSTEDESEYELLYDDKEKTLVITKGTIIEILDGAHRTMGIYEAYQENPEIEGKITVLFSNYTESQAKEYQVELAKQTPFNKLRARELAESTLSDELVNRLNSEGVLKGMISTKNIFNREHYITSFEILATAFDKTWNIERRSMILKVVDGFNKYLEHIYSEYENLEQYKLMFDKLAFIHHVIILKKLDLNNINTEIIEKYIEYVFIDNQDKVIEMFNFKYKSDYKYKLYKVISEAEKLINEFKVV